MSNFSSAILSGVAGNWTRLQAVLDGKLPARLFEASSNTLINMSSATPADLDTPGITLTDVELDEIIIFLFSHTVSCAQAAAVIGSRSYIDGVDQDNKAFTNGIASTSGVVGTQTTFAAATGLSGSITLTQKYWRDTGTGAVYSANRKYLGLILKARA